MTIPPTERLAKARVSKNVKDQQRSTQCQPLQVVTAELDSYSTNQESEVRGDDFDAGRCRAAQGPERPGQAAVIYSTGTIPM